MRPGIGERAQGRSEHDPERLPYLVQFLALMIAGWLNRQQQGAIEYLREENRYLRACLDGRRLRLTDRDRRRLADRGKRVGRTMLAELTSIAHPDTILRWYRELIAKKYEDSIRYLVTRMAREKPRWGYTRIQGALLHIGFPIGRSTVARILRDEGLDPAPKRRPTWNTFIQAHLGAIAGMDFFTIEALTLTGLVRKHVLFVIDIATRRVEIAGVVDEPWGAWVEQKARVLTDPIDGFLRNTRYVIHDRSSVFTARFHDILRGAGIEPIKLPAMSPNLNAFAERWVRSVKSECLDQVVILGDAHLHQLLSEYVAH